jgi:hypothetical protein
MVETPNSFKARTFDVGDKHYLLYKRGLSVSSPEGTTFGVFLLPTRQYAEPLAKRLQSAVDTEDEMWRWAEAFAALTLKASRNRANPMVT